MLAALYGAKTLLGTATPSIETWHNAMSGKYGLVELKERYKEIQLPEIIPVDIKELQRKKRMNGPFSLCCCNMSARHWNGKNRSFCFRTAGVCPDDRMPYVRVGSQM